MDRSYLWEKLHCLVLSTAPPERPRGTDAETGGYWVSNNDKRSKTKRSDQRSGRSPNQEVLGHKIKT